MSEPELWLAIRNWDKFQFYGMRRPMWIVNHVELLHDDNYLDLTNHQALLLHRLWLSYASARAQLRLNTRSLSRHTGLRVMRRDLDALNHAGFIEYLHAPRMHDAFPRARDEEKRREEENVEQRSSYEEPLATWSYPQVDETDETFDFEKIKYSPREMP